MKKVILKINDRQIEAVEGQTIFQVATDNGIDIPHMCHDPRLEPFTSCWLCVMEIKGFPRLVPSCTARVTEGMEVVTQSERITSARRTCLSLLLSDHYGDCIAPCQKACPDHIDIQGYLALICLGKYREALELIREVNPLPLSVGRVCPRFCERECRRNIVDEPVCINYLKRFVSDHAYEGINPSQLVQQDTGFKVAVIGAGPAGLSGAHFLRLKGHDVTLFEATPKPGGMMRYGIPEYRLPKGLMGKEIALISEMGVSFQYGKRFGRDINLKTLHDKGFHAVLFAIGAWADRRLGCDGEDLEGVVSGIGLLYKIAAGESVSIGKRVSVIGGGNTAIDAARSCLRMGAQEVHLIYRRSREEMPANAEEVHEAEIEGVVLHFLAAPVEVLGDTKGVRSIRCIRMELGEPDASGRRRPVPVKGSEFEFQTDMVIAAIGQFMADTDLLKAEGIPITKRGTIEINPESMQTGLEFVFAAGDCVSGPATVIEAIAGGRRAAAGIDRYLRDMVGKDVENGMVKEIEPIFYNHSKGDLTSIDREPFDVYEKIPRVKMPALSRRQRLKGFVEVELGLTEESARKEALRCLSCGCEAVFDCKLREYATRYNLKWEEIIQGRHNQYKIRDEHAFIFRDRNKCIRCGLCARICSEVEGASALGFVNRGFISIVDPPLEYTLKDSACDSCGLCLSTCPTGALEFRPILQKIGPWAARSTVTTCTLCGIGCQIIAKERAGYCIEVLPNLENSLNQGKLCWKGTFGWQMLNSPKRLQSPRRMTGGVPVKCSWGDAFSGAATAIKDLIDTGGKECIAILSSPRLTIEEGILLDSFADKLGIMDIYSPGRIGINAVIKYISPARYESIKDSDFILCLGSNIVDDYPVVSYMIKDAVKRGKELAIIGREDSRLTGISDYWIDCPPDEIDTILPLLSGIASQEGLLSLPADEGRKGIKTLNERDLEIIDKYLKKGDIKALVGRLINVKSPVLILNAGLCTENALAWLIEGIWKNEMGGNNHFSFIPLYRFGFSAQGINKKYIQINEMEKGVENGQIKGILSFGHWTGLEKLKRNYPGLTIVQSAIFSFQDGYHPDFLFPSSLPLETSGSFINNEGRVLALSRGFTPPGRMSCWDIIMSLAKAVGLSLDFSCLKEATAAVRSSDYRACDSQKRADKIVTSERTLTDNKQKKGANSGWEDDEIDIYLRKEIKEEKL